ncbi:unnamed protein product [Ectocarpus sp. CCAP 1310/34]|nr:unnamed protein product [Ectocarpus sp. CCAP 1310/34]
MPPAVGISPPPGMSRQAVGSSLLQVFHMIFPGKTSGIVDRCPLLRHVQLSGLCCCRCNTDQDKEGHHGGLDHSSRSCIMVSLVGAPQSPPLRSRL